MVSHKTYLLRKENKICVKCGKRKVKRKTFCSRCKKSLSIINKKKYKEMKGIDFYKDKIEILRKFDKLIMRQKM